MSQPSSAVLALLGVVFLLALAAMVLIVAGMWRIFTKADEPGWAALVPIYSQYTLCRVVGRPVWWLVLLLVPWVNVVFWLIIAMDLSRVFSRSRGFGVGLWLLPGVFVPVLGLGRSTYSAPAAVSTY